MEAAGFLSASIALLALSAFVKRGVLLATIVVFAFPAAAAFITLTRVVHEARLANILVDLLVASFYGILGWLVLRAVTSSWRLRRVVWRREAVGGIRRAVAELPRDDRFFRALLPLAEALAVYVAGFLVAVIVAIGTRIGLLAALALLPFAGAGSRMMQRARRTLGQRVAEVRARDARPPLLLVRSFQDDNLELEPRFEYFGKLVRKRVTLEEFVVSHLLTLGPVIAIGRPHEDLSPLGAAREYVFGPGWQERVETILNECSWVVSILGASEGLRWEYEQVIRRGLTSRFILIIPPAKEPVIRQRWGLFESAFPPASSVDWSATTTAGVPLCAIFPDKTAPMLFCSRFQNETAYSVVFAMLLDGLTPPT
jgi:hypothetical protein